MSRDRGLKCPCGGDLEVARKNPAEHLNIVLMAIGKPRWSRNRRIRKKLEKRWETEKLRPALLVAGFASAIRPPMYECTQCGRKHSFYGAIARNLIKVEPMPTPPGLVFYWDQSLRKEK
jgi:hypothetical protein